MSVSTAVSIEMGYTVQDAGLTPSGDTRVRVTGRAMVWLPRTLDEYLALPEHEQATCPECGWAGVMIVRDLCRCAQCSFTWRWPLTQGLD